MAMYFFIEMLALFSTHYRNFSTNHDVRLVIRHFGDTFATIFKNKNGFGPKSIGFHTSQIDGIIEFSTDLRDKLMFSREVRLSSGLFLNL